MSEREESAPTHRDLVPTIRRERWEKADEILEPVKSLVPESEEMRLIREKVIELLRQPIKEARGLLHQYAEAVQPTIHSYQGAEYDKAVLGYVLRIAEVWEEVGLSPAAIKELEDLRENARSLGMNDIGDAVTYKIDEIEHVDSLEAGEEHQENT